MARVTYYSKYVATDELLTKIAEWGNKFDPFFYYRTNNYQTDNYSNFNFLMGVGSFQTFSSEANYKAISAFEKFCHKKNDWLFGFFSYDFKNALENLETKAPKFFYFPDIYFVVPRYIFRNIAGKIVCDYEDSCDTEPIVIKLFEIIMQTEVSIDTNKIENITLHAKTTKSAYLNATDELLKHILRGDIYEVNYCMEFFADIVLSKPLHFFYKLIEISPTPFSAYVKVGGKHLLSASPERYLTKNGDKIISQPIKGTMMRGSTAAEDDLNKILLSTNQKELSENIMIVDLVRNDLSKIAQNGSVHVPELNQIHEFAHVFQLISTVEATLRSGLNWFDAIKASFPMGSMTGAPKIRAMQLIDKYEHSARNLYSGAVGYVTPGENFDFNVVIRSILYDQERNYLSFSAGSAITANSDLTNEYQECLLKTKAIRLLLGKND